MDQKLLPLAVPNLTYRGVWLAPTEGGTHGVAAVWNTNPRLMTKFCPIQPADMPQDIRDCLNVNVTVAGSRTVHAVGCYNPLEGEHRGDYKRLLGCMQTGWTTSSG